MSLSSPLNFSLILPALILTTSCASIMLGPTQRITISTDPPGALARIDPDGIEITTPAEVELKRSGDYTVYVELAGHIPRTESIGRTRSQESTGSVVAAGVVGLAVDEASGAAYTLGPDPFHILLEPIGGRPDTADTALSPEDRNFRVVFFNAERGTRRISINGSPPCKLVGKQYIVRELRGGSHALEISHWDVFWMKSERTLDVDGSHTHVALVQNFMSDDYVWRHGLPTSQKVDDPGFEEVCADSDD